jgi:hypothetical protein
LSEQIHWWVDEGNPYRILMLLGGWLDNIDPSLKKKKIAHLCQSTKWFAFLVGCCNQSHRSQTAEDPHIQHLGEGTSKMHLQTMIHTLTNPFLGRKPSRCKTRQQRSLTLPPMLTYRKFFSWRYEQRNYWTRCLFKTGYPCAPKILYNGVLVWLHHRLWIDVSCRYSRNTLMKISRFQEKPVHFALFEDLKKITRKVLYKIFLLWSYGYNIYGKKLFYWDKKSGLFQMVFLLWFCIQFLILENEAKIEL